MRETSAECHSGALVHALYIVSVFDYGSTLILELALIATVKIHFLSHLFQNYLSFHSICQFEYISSVCCSLIT